MKIAARSDFELHEPYCDLETCKHGIVERKAPETKDTIPVQFAIYNTDN